MNYNIMPSYKKFLNRIENEVDIKIGQAIRETARYLIDALDFFADKPDDVYDGMYIRLLGKNKKEDRLYLFQVASDIGDVWEAQRREIHDYPCIYFQWKKDLVLFLTIDMPSRIQTRKFCKIFLSEFNGDIERTNKLMIIDIENFSSKIKRSFLKSISPRFLIKCGYTHKADRGPHNDLMASVDEIETLIDNITPDYYKMVYNFMKKVKPSDLNGSTVIFSGHTETPLFKNQKYCLTAKKNRIILIHPEDQKFLKI